MPFQDNNFASRVTTGGDYRVGESNYDSGDPIDGSLFLPWPSDPANSYFYYECTVGVMLDSGIVIHSHLPQVDRTPDTLAAIGLDAANLPQYKDVGVNLSSHDQYQDIVQRMGHSRYWFRLWGQALRVGYKVPIPGIKTIGGVPAVPYDRNPQWAFNRIYPGGNFGGVILWHAVWSLWYTTASPPVSQAIPAADPGARITGSAPLPNGITTPQSQPDDNAVATAPTPFTVAGKPLK